MTQELHTASFKVVDAALDLQVATAHLLTDGFAVLQHEIHGVEDVQPDGLVGDLIGSGLLAALTLSLRHHGAQLGQQHIQGVIGFLLSMGKVGSSGSLESSAGGVAQDKDQPSVQSPGAEFQAAKDRAFSMSTSVASIAQHKQVSWQGIKDRFQWHTRIGTAHHSGMGRLALRGQCFAHLAVNLSKDWDTGDEALIAILQHLQSHLGFQGSVLSGAEGPNSHGRWKGHLGGQQLVVSGRTTQEFHSTGLQVVDATLDVQLTLAHQLTNGFAKLQQEIHAVVDVHLHRMAHQLLLGHSWAQVVTRFLGHTGQAL
mmetsp:Transcript_65700/g.104394  ORF Transcript_65700/g.104394 Transcript_65700/m.104394 type:complete len:313 (+) Transcript_65700:1262-2200(+)